MVGHYAWRREFVEDLAETAGENRKTLTEEFINER
jgi:hypothetical protein